MELKFIKVWNRKEEQWEMVSTDVIARVIQKGNCTNLLLKDGTELQGGEKFEEIEHKFANLHGMIY